LKWTTPPSRQLSRQKRVEYESDIRERFYDDYLGARTGRYLVQSDVIEVLLTWSIYFPDGDARNEVFTTSQLAKHRHDPKLYRVNAYTGLNYDPMSELLFFLFFFFYSCEHTLRESNAWFCLVGGIKCITG